MLESNVFNVNEGIGEEECQTFASETADKLKVSGIAILLEPTIYSKRQPIWQAMSNENRLREIKNSRFEQVDLSGIRLLEVAERLGLRTNKMMTHRFSYSIYQKLV